MAQAWLGELLISLSRTVKPYDAVLMTPLPGEEPAAAYADAVNVVPFRARAIAAQLREASDRAGAQNQNYKFSHFITIFDGYSRFLFFHIKLNFGL